MKLFLIQKYIQIQRNVIRRHVKSYIFCLKKGIGKARKHMFPAVLGAMIPAQVLPCLYQYHCARLYGPIRSVEYLFPFFPGMAHLRQYRPGLPMAQLPLIAQLPATFRKDHRCIQANLITIVILPALQYPGLANQSVLAIPGIIQSICHKGSSLLRVTFLIYHNTK